MANLDTATVTLDAEIGPFTRNMKRARGQMEASARSFGRSVTNFGRNALSLRGAMTALAGASGLGLVAKKVMDVGAAVQETDALFGTVFGAATDDMQSFVDDFANFAGLTTTQAKDLTASMGAMTDAFGATSQQSVELSQNALKLAADIASANNVAGGAEAVMQAMQSAMIGNTEAMRSMNVAFTQNEVNQRALEETGKANVQQLTQLEKSMAAFEIITERAGVAVGDLERTQDSVANRSRRLGARIRELRDAFAVALLPAFEVALEHFETMLGTSGLEGLSKEFKKQGPVVRAWAQFTIDAIEVIVEAFRLLIRTAFNVGQTIGEVANVLVLTLTGRLGDAREAGERLAGNLLDIGDAFGDFGTKVTESFDSYNVAMRSAADTTSESSEQMTRDLDNVAASANNAAAAVGGVSGPSPDDFAVDPIDRQGAAGGLDTGGISLPDSMGTLIEQGTDNLNDGLKKALETGKALEGVMVGTFNSALDAMLDFTNDTAAAFGKMAAAAVAALTKIIVKLLVIKALQAIGIPVPNQLASVGSFAQGGNIVAGRAAIVGEKGPELIVPQSNATVVPNNELPLNPAGGNIEAVLAAAGPRPRAMTPDAVATDSWWRETFTELARQNAGRV